MSSKALSSPSQWNFLTNHAHVLISLSQDPEQTLRQVALKIGITERAVQRIVAGLEQGGYIHRERDGRRNHYSINQVLNLRHPLEQHVKLAAFLALIHLVEDLPR